MRWYLFTVTLILATAGGWLHAHGVPVEKAVPVAYKTISAPADWDRYDWAAIGVMLGTTLAWWRKRPNWMRWGKARAPLTHPMADYVANLREITLNRLKSIEKAMREGMSRIDFHELGADGSAALRKAVRQNYANVRETPARAGYDLAFEWSVVHTPTPHPDDQLPF